MNSTTTLSQSQHEQFTRAMSLNLAAWTEASIQPYGVSATMTDTLWWRQPGASGIYLPATIIDGHCADDALFADLETVTNAWHPKGFLLYDCWANRDLTPLGFEKIAQNPWYIRLPGPMELLSMPDGFMPEFVTRQTEFSDFEQATLLGFEVSEDELDSHKPFDTHHPATMAGAGMLYINGRMYTTGDVVSSIITHKTADVVGIYGLSTLPAHRRRGYAAALVGAATAVHKELPIVVQPDPPSVPMYTRLGYVVGGEVAMWRKV